MSTVRELRKKAEKRDRLGSLKKGLEQVNAKGSLLESLEFEEEDVFDVLDEDQYEELVESRRKGDDFVVDDGTNTLFLFFRISYSRYLFLFIYISEGHGYYDDGEEHIGVVEDEYDRKIASYSTYFAIHSNPLI